MLFCVVFRCRVWCNIGLIFNLLFPLNIYRQLSEQKRRSTIQIKTRTIKVRNLLYLQYLLFPLLSLYLHLYLCGSKGFHELVIILVVILYFCLYVIAPVPLNGSYYCPIALMLHLIQRIKFLCVCRGCWGKVQRGYDILWSDKIRKEEWDILMDIPLILAMRKWIIFLCRPILW